MISSTMHTCIRSRYSVQLYLLIIIVFLLYIIFYIIYDHYIIIIVIADSLPNKRL